MQAIITLSATRRMLCYKAYRTCIYNAVKFRMAKQKMHTRGFTLIEILVVMVIIGIMLVSVAIKIFPDERQTLRQEAERLGLLLEQARDEAFLSGRSIAWTMQKHSYEFSSLNAERQWTPITNNQILRTRSLPTSITLSALSINQLPVDLNTHLIFSPSGLNTSFTATLTLQGYRLILQGDNVGHVKIKDEN